MVKAQFEYIQQSHRIIDAQNQRPNNYSDNEMRSSVTHRTDIICAGASL